MKTEKRKMTKAAFVEHAASEVEKLEANPNEERSALLKAAFAASKSVEDGTEFEVEVVVDEPATVDLTEVNAKLDDIAAKVSKLEAGTVEKTMHDAVVAKQGLAVDLAVELLTAYQAKINDLSEKLQAGGEDLERDKLWETFNSWSVEDAVANALTTLGKSENAPDEATAKEVGEALKAAFEAKKGDDTPAPEANDDPAPDPEVEKVETCKQCGADMGGEEVCPECGWKVGTEVKEKTEKSSSQTFQYQTRYTGSENK